LLKGAKSTSDLGRPFAGTLYEREARFLAQEELATEGEDVFERRTKHGLHLTDTERAQFAAWFQMLTPQAV
jgi:glycerol-3-phosphate dehydrogenase